jgi:uncharacterized membrane protein
MIFRPPPHPRRWLALGAAALLLILDLLVIRQQWLDPLSAGAIWRGLFLVVGGVPLGLMIAWGYAQRSLLYGLDRSRLEIQSPEATVVIPTADIQRIVPMDLAEHAVEYAGIHRFGLMVGWVSTEALGPVRCIAATAATRGCCVFAKQGAFYITPQDVKGLLEAYEDRTRLGPTQSAEYRVSRFSVAPRSLLADHFSLAALGAGLWLNLVTFLHATYRFVIGDGAMGYAAARAWQLPLVGLLVWMLDALAGGLAHRRDSVLARLLFVSSLLSGGVFLAASLSLSPPSAVQAALYWFLAGLSLCGALALGGYQRLLLTDGGAFLFALAGGLIAGLGGWVAGLVYVGASVATVALGRRAEFELGENGGSPDRHDIWRLISWSGLAILLAAAMRLRPDGGWMAGYLGVMGAVVADAWATLRGSRRRTLSRQALLGNQVPQGTPGAISAIGMLWSGLGAALVGLMALVFRTLDTIVTSVMFDARAFLILLIALVGGLVGSMCDSLLNVALSAFAERDRDGDAGRAHTEMGEIRGHVVHLVASLLGGLAALGLAAGLGWTP